jgi:hypothetical protein
VSMVLCGDLGTKIIRWVILGKVVMLMTEVSGLQRGFSVLMVPGWNVIPLCIQWLVKKVQEICWHQNVGTYFESFSYNTSNVVVGDKQALSLVTLFFDLFYWWLVFTVLLMPILIGSFEFQGLSYHKFVLFDEWIHHYAPNTPLTKIYEYSVKKSL